jgi:aspartyl-tRNA(Asn)/glutamyl-tRNA(Gln) amidotransferase subunit B
VKYETIIGIECHVQLKTKTKLFCGCNNDAREADPNTTVCPVCMGFPGALPVLNEQAVKLALRLGLALNGDIPKFTKFDRKNYFYPDLPSGYQISQFDQPIVGKGHVDVPVGDKLVKVGITRAHLEADAGKLTHPDGVDYSLVDLNRSGTPLVEIVSEPDMRSSAEAKAYAQELYNIVRYADVSDANLYYGNMRFDVNVSLRPEGQKEFGTRTETKNLNSFKAVERAVEYEVKRQADLLDKGEKIVQETRGWDDAKQRTFSQRSKEEAHDYRYFPEPDLPPVVVTDSMLDEAKKSLGHLPADMRKKLEDSGVNPVVANTLVNQLELVQRHMDLFEQPKEHAQRMANWLSGEVMATTSEDFDWAGYKLTTKNLHKLSELVGEGNLSQTAAKELLVMLVTEDHDPLKLAEEKKLIQVSDSAELATMVSQVLAANEASVVDYKAGKQQAFGFLVGQVMKQSKGQANPQMVNELLRKELDN